MSTANHKFKQDCQRDVQEMASDAALREATIAWMSRANSYKYSYHFEFLGRPLIQYPQDVVAVQELVWRIKPDLIIETGIAHGGSLIASASWLAMLEYCDAVQTGSLLDPKSPERFVLGVDIDIRRHNREAIEAHPMSSRIKMIEGSSTSPEVLDEVREFASGFENVMVLLDSNHTHDHVICELREYSAFVTVGSYCVVFDTIIEDLPVNSFDDRPWDVGDNPKTAVREFLSGDQRFRIDADIDSKLQISVAPEGYLFRVD